MRGPLHVIACHVGGAQRDGLGNGRAIVGRQQCMAAARVDQVVQRLQVKAERGAIAGNFLGQRQVGALAVVGVVDQVAVDHRHIPFHGRRAKGRHHRIEPRKHQRQRQHFLGRRWPGRDGLVKLVGIGVKAVVHRAKQLDLVQVEQGLQLNDQRGLRHRRQVAVLGTGGVAALTVGHPLLRHCGANSQRRARLWRGRNPVAGARVINGRLAEPAGAGVDAAHRRAVAEALAERRPGLAGLSHRADQFGLAAGAFEKVTQGHGDAPFGARQAACRWR